MNIHHAMMMKIATYNANSIRARRTTLQDWLERERPDILSIQETKVQDKDFPVDLFDSCGYHVVFRGQKSYKRGGRGDPDSRVPGSHGPERRAVRTRRRVSSAFAWDPFP